MKRIIQSMNDWNGLIVTSIEIGKDRLPHFNMWFASEKGFFRAEHTGDKVETIKVSPADLDRSKIVSFLVVPEDVQNDIYEATRWLYKKGDDRYAEEINMSEMRRP